ncbi:hypothetical protein RYH73_03415 [Olivibacter sp. CPCC 100613]|uniref:hypothetical protein n=1 Tax=Olivibacter sp. CPCC 100613 TaxID=3079931 RepID=UPI002FF60543
MAKIQIKITGLKEAKSALKKVSDTVEIELDSQLANSANRIRTAARAKATENLKEVGQNWVYEHEHLVHQVHNQLFWAPFAEFGTGPFAAKTVAPYDPEWQEHAKQFYRNGEGTMPATPMLYPAVKEEELKLPKILEKAIREEINKSK